VIRKSIFLTTMKLWSLTKIKFCQDILFTTILDVSEDSEKCHLLWVDHSPENNSSLITNLESQGVKITKFLNTHSLFSWLALNYKKNKEKLKIISNRNRPGDGEESAGVRLFQCLHESDDWQHIPFLLFCGNANLVKDLPSGVLVTDTEDGVVKFAL